MENLQRFMKFGDERINLDEIVCYGLGIDDEDDRFLYVETKTSEDLFRYYEGAEETDFDIEKKLEELDKILLFRKRGRVDFDKT